ncbi:MAG: OmpA family protein [Bacteroidales bacterium]|nr:OmpA family protein [Bacteroidales bacterium]
MKRTILIGIALLLTGLLMGQSKWISKADRASERNDFTATVRYYKKALEETTDPLQKQCMQINIAWAYNKMSYYQKALSWIEKAYDSAKAKPETISLYATTLARTGKTDQAKQVIEMSLKHFPENADLKEILKELERTAEGTKKKTSVNLQKVDELNSQYSDYAPFMMFDKLVFASTRFEGEEAKIDGRTSQGFSDLFISAYDTAVSEWSTPERIEGPLNSKYNDGTFSFNEKNMTGYVMRCPKSSPNCKLIMSKYDSTMNAWSDPTELSINSDEHSVGHPCIREDGKVLYFVSDMGGGYGGKDIWKVIKNDAGEWGLPINLGTSVNTKADEMFPFMLGDSLLFFASDGHRGYGGLDNFFSFMKDIDFSPAVNPGHPFNSPSDDFGMIILDDLSGGYLTSNREVENSDDIYHFDGLPFFITISGKVKDAENGQTLAKAKVSFNYQNIEDSVFTNQNGYYLYENFRPYSNYNIRAEKRLYHPESRTLKITDRDIIYSTAPSFTMDFALSKKTFPVAIKGKVTERKTGERMPGIRVELSGSNGFSSDTFTDEEGVYEFDDLKHKATYTARVSKEGYFSESRSVEIPEVEQARTFSKETGYDMDFVLTKIEKKKEIVLNNIYYDFDKATLRPESKTELNKLASMLKETPEVYIQISSHTDERGPDSYNQGLSERRAQSVVDYLVSQGIDPGRLIARGYGETKLLIENAITEDEHQQNRRTTFKVTEIKEKPAEPAAEPTEDGTLSFRVQLMSTQQPIQGQMMFKPILEYIPNTQVFVRNENGLFKYEIGSRKTLKEASTLKQELKEMGYKDCFINAYLDGKKISISKAKEIDKN